MDKKSLSEQDIRTKFITPAILKAGWDLQTQIREEVTFTAGRVMVRGRIVSRGQAKRADYILYYKPNIPVAIVEAKDNNHSVGDGMQQAIDYGRSIDVPFVYSTNGDAFLEHDRTVESGQIEGELSLDSFPSPDELWRRYCAYKSLNTEHQPVLAQDYYVDASGKAPRYYQLVAINRAVEAIVKGQDRILLVMATGTGKTYTAFQIIWRLWKSRMKKRILFLADRNILVDQARMNDFKPFGSAMTKIKHRQVDKSYEVYLALYQAVTGTEDEKNIYKQFSKDFFDLVVVDECHRGSAAEDSAWREVLEYFESATQIGMTATPKETKYVSNIEYFGDPLYIYSLRQGIEDGFLAPYKVIRIDIDKDLTGWRPSAGERDKYGRLIEDRIYNQKDYDRLLVLEKRTELVAKKVTEFLQLTDRFDKSIVFCEDIDHAERMRRNLVNENADLVSQNDKYIMRITGDESLGKAELDNFIDPESRYPVIATTSKLLSTGVDVQTCKLIVLDQNVQSLSSFKQIIGRGTRIQEEYKKLYFTIIDFRKATELFADPEFDGEPVQIYEPKPGGSPKPPDEPEEPKKPPKKPVGRIKYIVNNVEVFIVAERVQYYGSDGKLITESLRDYTRRNVLKDYESLNSFLKTWSSAEKKQAIIEELNEQGVFLDALAEEVGRDYDPFDLICHVVFDQPPLTRRERANNVRKRNYFTKYGENAQAVLNALLDKYADTGIVQIEDINILKVPPIEEIGTPIEIVGYFGGRNGYMAALRELEKLIYSAA
ncbi:MAG: DEAD/DEAH box helicase family protein [Candidatus Krumholzibacteria bacterium]|nr:DEAD/DEAH box helicase family protein [Candidatus Krumholzibacteria bacterium]